PGFRPGRSLEPQQFQGERHSRRGKPQPAWLREFFLRLGLRSTVGLWPFRRVVSGGSLARRSYSSRAPGTIVLVRTLSRSHAHRFSEASRVLRAKLRTRNKSQGRTATWKTKFRVRKRPLRMKWFISGSSKLRSSEIALTAINGRPYFSAARATAAASISTACTPYDFASCCFCAELAISGYVASTVRPRLLSP